MDRYIEIKGAAENNLQNINLKIPRNQITAVVGVSGSGKSTLIIDTLQKESLRQFFDTMSNQEQVKKPKVDTISGLSPAVFINQSITNRNPRSTVGTVSGILKKLRFLYSQAGVRECPSCGYKIQPIFAQFDSEEWANDDETGENTESEPGQCPNCHGAVKMLRMSDLSYNSISGACPRCHGIGEVYHVDREFTIDENLSIYEGAFKSWGKSEYKAYIPVIANAGRYYGFDFDPHAKIRDYSREAKAFVYYGNDDERFKQYYPNVERPLAKDTLFRGFINDSESRYERELDNRKWTERFGKFMKKTVCDVCNGSRLSPEIAEITIMNTTLNQLMTDSVSKIYQWITDYEIYIQDRAEGSFIMEIVQAIRNRLKEMIHLGLGYLSLSRSIISLSFGEHQRIRLANLLGSSLTGMIYIFDEPTIGLHPSDNDKIIHTLKTLKEQGNTIILIEHDPDLIRTADYIVEIGPGGGTNGGRLVFAGTFGELKNHETSVIRKYLTTGPDIPKAKGVAPTHKLQIVNAKLHNLKNIHVDIMLNQMNVVTGVSGSGKSSLIIDLLAGSYEEYCKSGHLNPDIIGIENISNVVCITQKPLSKGSRSNIATYTDIYSDLRALYARQEKALELKLDKSAFSTNREGGRCEYCQGQGVVDFNMVLMPTMVIKCPKCKGKRFKRHVLEVKYKGKSISDILNTTCTDALELFRDVPGIAGTLRAMDEIGVGYLTLGHQLNQLSGGECQRIRLVKELVQNTKGKNLYIFDEPTTGLHPQDIEKLYSIMQGLIMKNHTLIVIEHNIDMILKANHIIDLGVGSGEDGGNLIYQGNLAGLLACEDSVTGKYINQYLKPHFSLNLVSSK